jgi:hypothetical protein
MQQDKLSVIAAKVGYVVGRRHAQGFFELTRRAETGANAFSSLVNGAPNDAEYLLCRIASEVFLLLEDAELVTEADLHAFSSAMRLGVKAEREATH